MTGLLLVPPSKKNQFITIKNYNTLINATTKSELFKMKHWQQATLPFDQQNEMISLAQDSEHSQTIKIRMYLEKLISEVRNNIIRNQHRYKTRYGLHEQDLLLKMNDLVLEKTKEIRRIFYVRYECPFKIIKQLGSTTFAVQYCKKLTLTRQITMDVIVELIERWNSIQ